MRPSPSIAWPALVIRLRKIWFSCDGEHSICGSLPYWRTMPTRPLSWVWQIFSAESRPSLTLNRSLRERSTREKSLRSEEHTSELQSLMRISYAVFCLKQKNNNNYQTTHN